MCADRTIVVQTVGPSTEAELTGEAQFETARRGAAHHPFATKQSAKTVPFTSEAFQTVHKLLIIKFQWIEKCNSCTLTSA